MIEAVEKLFDARVRVIFSDLKESSRDEIIRAALQHERKKACLDNIVLQLRALRLQRHMTQKNFLAIISSCADMYCAAVLEHLKQRILSSAERQRRIDEANRIQQFEQEFADEQKDLTDTRIKSYPDAPARRGIEI